MTYFFIFIFIFLFNLAPAFTPPTWMALSYFAVKLNPNPYLLAFLGAAAATFGRLTLAKLANVIVRERFLRQKTVANLNAVKEQLEKRTTLTFSVFLIYAFGPLPSNQLFLAYGLTGLKLRLIALPFFIGRFISYLFWIIVASTAHKTLQAQQFASGKFFSSYFIIAQILTLAVVYVFTKIDWKKLFNEKKLSWLK